MGLLDDIIPDLVADLIPEFTDNKITITTTKQRYDFATDTRVASSQQDYEVFASPPFPYKTNQIDNETVKAQDFELIVPAAGLPIVPDVKDTITMKDSKTGRKQVFQVVMVEKLISGDLVAAYVIQCRK